MEKLKEKWKDIVFARVTRVVTRAHDLSLWSTDGNRVYLGDNAAALNGARARWEYDYYFGFCKDFGGRTFHFASPQVGKLDFLTKGNGEWIDSISLLPPAQGMLICGVPSLSSKGITLTKWCFCHNAFFELWKLLFSKRRPKCDANMLRKLAGPIGTPEHHIYQAIALTFIYGHTIPETLKISLPQVMDKNFLDTFLEQLN